MSGTNPKGTFNGYGEGPVPPPLTTVFLCSTGYTPGSLMWNYTLADIQSAVLTTAAFAALNLSALPTSNPGGGKPWLNAGVLTVG